MYGALRAPTTNCVVLLAQGQGHLGREGGQMILDQGHLGREGGTAILTEDGARRTTGFIVICAVEYLEILKYLKILKYFRILA
jgi:hypothetical protein